MNAPVRFGRLTRSGRALVTVTLRGGVMLGVAVLALVVAYLADWPELLIVACFSGIPPIIALILVAILRPRLTVARAVSPSTLGAGTSGTVTLRVRNDAPVKTLPARWSDLLPWGETTTPGQELPPLPPHNTQTVSYSFVPPVRGIRELGPLLTEVFDPFGLARAQFAIGERSRIVVAPPSISLAPSAVEIASDRGSARLFDHRALAGEHDIMTRDYRPGDALRRVHWKASAHYGDLMVREDEKHSNARALILLDTRRRSYRDTSRVISNDRSESENFEWALSMANSLRDHWVASGLRVRVAETAVAQLADATNGDDFVESLARVRLSYQDPSAIRLTDEHRGPHGSIVAILDAPDPETIAALIAQRGSFTIAAAFLLNPTNTDLASRLEHAGWSVHRVSNAETVSQAWHALGVSDE
ncbi:MAG: DUF58 domain-containing protein [Terrimesophilobacter sp.]